MSATKFIFFFLLFSIKIFSQADTQLVNNAPKNILLKLGKNALLQGDPNSAITFFEAFLKKDPKNAQAFYLAGQAYWQTRYYEKAQKYFLTSYRIDKKKSIDALYFHSLALKSSGKYDSAKYYFDKFKKEYKGRNKNYKKISAHEVAYCDSVAKYLNKNNNIEVTHLDSAVNKVNTEASPIALNDSTLIFSSLRTNEKLYVPEDEPEKASKKKLFYARKEKGKWKFNGELGEDLNSDEFNLSSATLSPDKKRLYMSQCKPNQNGEMICAIYMSQKNGDGWTIPKKLPKSVNKRGCSNTMPAVTTDVVKGTDVLYFVSDRSHGKGGLDIWYSVYDYKLKTFKPAKNAGSHINTIQNEITPFFDNETRSLYFSSDGQPGLGGYDIFKAIGDGKKWEGVINMGDPFNSGADDIYFSIGTKRSEGFLVSNRKGGFALKHETCCDDIYSFKILLHAYVDLNGIVNNVVDGHPVENAVIEIYSKDPKTGEKYFKKQITTDSLGKYKTELEIGDDYFMVVKEKDFLGKSEEISTKGMKTSQVIEKKFDMIKKPKGSITIPNINYEFDKSDLTKSSLDVLDSVIVNLMHLNPEIIVEIQSHTDSKGSEATNLKLSQKRAESVVKYLVSIGIDSKHVHAKGYGESQPIAPNQNADGSDNPEGRARNRRTDFKIIGTVDSEIIYESGH